jgi:hypothetical protein
MLLLKWTLERDSLEIASPVRRRRFQHNEL